MVCLLMVCSADGSRCGEVLLSYRLGGVACGAVGCLPTVLAFPCFLIGLLGSLLCGAAPTFFAAAKKVGKESGLQPPACRCPSRSSTGNGPRRDVPSRHT